MTADQTTVTASATPDLRVYDVVLVNSSAGKDSQASLDVVVEHARAANALAKVVVVHADLGDAEWDGVPELAAEHAAHYGLRFELARRTAADGHTETILERVATRGMWPDAARRWCTSDHKRGPIRKIMTSLVAELRDSGTVVDRPVRPLNVMGLRAAESHRACSPRAVRGQPGGQQRQASRGRVVSDPPLHRRRGVGTHRCGRHSTSSGLCRRNVEAELPPLRAVLTGGPGLLSTAEPSARRPLRRRGSRCRPYVPRRPVDGRHHRRSPSRQCTTDAARSGRDRLTPRRRRLAVHTLTIASAATAPTIVTDHRDRAEAIAALAAYLIATDCHPSAISSPPVMRATT